MPERPDTLAPAAADGTTYLRQMCARHAHVEGNTVVVDLPQQQLNALGVFLVQAVFGFILGLNPEQSTTGQCAAAAASHTGERETRPLSSN